MSPLMSLMWAFSSTLIQFSSTDNTVARKPLNSPSTQIVTSFPIHSFNISVGIIFFIPFFFNRLFFLIILCLLFCCDHSIKNTIINRNHTYQYDEIGITPFLWINSIYFPRTNRNLVFEIIIFNAVITTTMSKIYTNLYKISSHKGVVPLMDHPSLFNN